MYKIIFCALFFLITPLLFALPNNVKREIDHTVKKYMNDEQIPGMSLAIVSDKGVLHLADYGFSKLESATLVNSQTRYPLASISKTFAGFLSLILADEGRLNLEYEAKDLVAEAKHLAKGVTLRRLLSNTAGIRHYKNNNELILVKDCTRLNQGLAQFINDPLVSTPGSVYLYSSFGFNLAGAIIESATRQEYFSLLREKILNRIAMQQTVVDSSKDGARVVGYYRKGNKLIPAAVYDASCKIPAGGVSSTIKDMGLYAQELLRKNSVISDKVKLRAWQTQITREGSPTKYGLGWSVGPWNKINSYWHSGSQPGISTLIWIIPSQNVGMVILSNRGELDLFILAKKLVVL
jgi:CubicO group peptidase (beta-lactamase class C family)